MQISKYFSNRRKTQESILSELKSLNDNLVEIRSDLTVFRSLNGIMGDLAKKNGEFVEVIRHFFAIERTKKDEENKHKLEEEEESKPTKHDFLF